MASSHRAGVACSRIFRVILKEKCFNGWRFRQVGLVMTLTLQGGAGGRDVTMHRVTSMELALLL
jgi:hypothetical protein